MKVQRLIVDTVIAGALGCALGAGGAALPSVPVSMPGPGDASGIGITQAYASTSKAAKAKKAYKRMLSGTGFTWGYNRYNSKPMNPANYKFALGDINGDRVPELFVENTSTYYAAGCCRVYAYQKGRVKRLLTFSAPPEIFTKGHVLYYCDQHTGSYWGRYFKLTGGKLKYKAGWSGTDMPAGRFHCVGYTVNGKKASRSAYRKQVKKLLKGSKKTAIFYYHSNTSDDRAYYL